MGCVFFFFRSGSERKREPQNFFQILHLSSDVEDELGRPLLDTAEDTLPPPLPLLLLPPLPLPLLLLLLLLTPLALILLLSCPGCRCRCRC